MEFRPAFFASCITSCLLATSAAQAEGVYLLGSIGQSHISFDELKRSDIDDAFAFTGATVNSSGFDKTDTAYKAQIGYQFNENFALEGGYMDLGTAAYKANISVGSSSGNAKYEWKTTGWNIDALVTLPVNAGVSLFGKLGLIYAKTEFDASADGTNVFSEDTKKTSPLLGFGIAYNFWQGLSVRGEYEHFFNLGDKNDVGDKLTIDLFSVGLSYQF